MDLVLFIGFLLVSALHCCNALRIGSPPLQTATFLSPPVFLHPGSVSNKYYFDIPFPRGHIAIKSFTSEVVDENGTSVPLYETYLHHWLVERYYAKIGTDHESETADGIPFSDIILIRNSGTCNNTFQHYYGLGSETRRTSGWIPDPFGVEVGNPSEIPDGYEEKWLLNVHAIDPRGTVDPMGCTECRCNLYNLNPSSDYIGGLHCCHDQVQCKVKDGVQLVKRFVFLKYTVKWVDWNAAIIPVRIYILDVTDEGRRCKVEYTVNSCSDDETNSERVNTRTTKLVMPQGGNIVYGAAHQHTGGVGAALLGQDGRTLCASFPIYGQGTEAGNESNYIVGMSSCYPNPGSVTIQDGEILTVVSNYSCAEMHTGVMGLIYLIVSEPQSQLEGLHKLPPVNWMAVLVVAAVVVSSASVMSCFRRKSREGGQYESLQN